MENIDIEKVGKTAFVVACLRTIGKKHKNRLFNDPYAEWFINDKMKSTVQQLQIIFPESSDTARCRFYKLNEIVEKEINGGVTQIVILGSGFDMRSQIFATEGVNFYEVDQPAVLQFKHEILKNHGVTPCASVPCNYLEVNLPEKLAEVGLDINTHTLFVWEGNSMYLPADLLYDLLNRLHHQIPSFTIIFDYFSDKFVNRTSGNKKLENLADLFEQRLGVKWATGFDNSEVFEKKTGLKIVESGDIIDTCKHFYPEFPTSLSNDMGIWFYCILKTP